ncbi:hypothetical protein ACFL6U_27060 [Planctomycetota bacterium]
MKRVSCLCLCLVTSPVWAWYAEGHRLITHRAVDILADPLPVFFIAGKETIAHCSVDPDVFKFKTDAGLLKDDEYPEHFFDLELFDDSVLPANRTDFFFWCLRNSVYIQKIGTLPYALGEETDRLTVAFAEYRRWPDNPVIQAKCLVYAGNLAHYAQDLCQPLHTTIDYDGRANDNGASPRTGIHAKVDALLGKLDAGRLPTITSTSIVVYDDLLSAILSEIQASHQQVDSVYALEAALPDADDSSLLNSDSDVGKFAHQCLHASAQVTASFFLTAWIKSETIEIPSYHQR